MRCFGLNKRLLRCQKTQKWPFCHFHRFQPLAFFFALVGAIAMFGGLYQDVVIPLSGQSFPLPEATPESDVPIRETIEINDGAIYVSSSQDVNESSKYVGRFKQMLSNAGFNLAPEHEGATSSLEFDSNVIDHASHFVQNKLWYEVHTELTVTATRIATGASLFHYIVRGRGVGSTFENAEREAFNTSLTEAVETILSGACEPIGQPQ